MVEKSTGKIVTGTLSIIAAALLFISNLAAVIDYGKYGIFNVYFVGYMIFMLGGVALTVLSIVGLIRFSDANNRKVGMASVICFAGINIIWLLRNVIGLIISGDFYIDGLLIFYLLAGIGLLIAFFVCGSQFPVGMKNAHQSNGINEFYAFPAAQQSAAADTTVPAAGVADEIKKYKELLDSGAITQEEYEAKKAQLLGL